MNIHLSIRESANRRRGMTILAIIILLVALTAFISLAVDMGRMQCAKSELCTAADAAARAACGSLSSGTVSAQNAAVAAALANTCDGSSVVLTPGSDLTFGQWDQTAETFTALNGANTSNANSVKI